MNDIELQAERVTRIRNLSKEPTWKLYQMGENRHAIKQALKIAEDKLADMVAKAGGL